MHGPGGRRPHRPGSTTVESPNDCALGPLWGEVEGCVAMVFMGVGMLTYELFK